MTTPTLTVAILTRNRLPQLKKALEGLARQEPRPDEVLVVDTGSTDGTREWVRARAGQNLIPDQVGESAKPGDADHKGLCIRLIEDSGRGAYAGARNRAVLAARGDIIAFLDDDCEPDRRWVRRILDRFDADPGLDVLGGVTLPARALPFPQWWPPEVNWALGLSGPGCWGPEAGRVHLAQTSNLAFRRRAWEAVKFGELGEKDFSEGGAVYDSGREDVDWWRRLRRMGWRSELDGKLIAWHDIPAARLDWKDALDRARRDGRSHWRRAGTKADARAAASDLVHGPVRFLQRLKHKGTTPAQALRHTQLWSARQAALLEAAVESWDKPLHPSERAGMVVKESARMTAGVGKWAARRTAATLHRAIRLTRPIPSPDTRPRALLLVACGFMGDQLLIQPALRVIRRSYPDTELVLLTSRFGQELYGPEAPEEDRRWVDRVVNADEWKGLPVHRRHHALHRLVSELNPEGILVFYAHGLWPAPLFLAANAPVIGFDRDSGFGQQLWHDLLTIQFYKDWSVHEVLNHARLARCIGAEGELEPFRVTVPEDLRRGVDERLRAQGLAWDDALSVSPPRDGKKGFIAINTGLGKRYKEWPLDRWFQLAQRVVKETPYAVALVGGREEAIVAERFQARGLKARNLCGLSLRAMTAALRRARFLVGGDSGPKHLAMAGGIPTLTLHGATEEHRWGAFWDRDRHETLRCGLHDLTMEDLRGLPENWAMRLIEVEDVYERLSRFLLA